MYTKLITFSFWMVVVLANTCSFYFCFNFNFLVLWLLPLEHNIFSRFRNEHATHLIARIWVKDRTAALITATEITTILIRLQPCDLEYS